MTRNNPITQLKALKAQMQAQKRTESTSKSKGKANTKVSEKNAQKANEQRFLAMAQISRMFDQTNASIEHCKLNFPDCYHHKHRLAKECEKVAQMLDDGGLLLAQLVQLVGHQTLTTEQKTVLANFKAVKNYLTGNFRATAKHVKAVEDGTATKCYRERFVKDEVKQNDK
ncbi:hypothetical protein [Haemophilus parahaemolyticus]|uniref:hypothetical protein n=1 Tax=Haemophilus parahaemolyticus TaxID=735 RepID=UPI002889712B|nr:hypothetical protein [Haemophilus parahaemolyticus]